MNTFCVHGGQRGEQRSGHWSKKVTVEEIVSPEKLPLESTSVYISLFRPTFTEQINLIVDIQIIKS